MLCHGRLLAHCPLSRCCSIRRSPIPHNIAVCFRHFNDGKWLYQMDFREWYGLLWFWELYFLLVWWNAAHCVAFLTDSFMVNSKDLAYSIMDIFTCLIWTVEWQFSTSSVIQLLSWMVANCCTIFCSPIQEVQLRPRSWRKHDPEVHYSACNASTHLDLAGVPLYKLFTQAHKGKRYMSTCMAHLSS